MKIKEYFRRGLAVSLAAAFTLSSFPVAAESSAEDKLAEMGIDLEAESGSSEDTEISSETSDAVEEDLNRKAEVSISTVDGGSVTGKQSIQVDAFGDALLDTEVRIYLWDSKGEVPDDKDTWAAYLTSPSTSILFDSLNDANQLELQAVLADGTLSTIYADYVETTEADGTLAEAYLSFVLPMDAAVTDTITLIPSEETYGDVHLFVEAVTINADGLETAIDGAQMNWSLPALEEPEVSENPEMKDQSDVEDAADYETTANISLALQDNTTTEQSISVDASGSNIQDTAVRIYLWNYPADLPEDTSQWEYYLTEASSLVDVNPQDDSEFVELQSVLSDGSIFTVAAEFIQSFNDDGSIAQAYLEFTIPVDGAVSGTIGFTPVEETSGDVSLFLEAVFVDSEGNETPVDGISLTWNTLEAEAADSETADSDENNDAEELEIEDAAATEYDADPAATGSDADSDQTNTLVYEGTDYIVTVTYGEDAQIPDDAELIATEYEKDSETWQSRYAEAVELYGWEEETEFRLFKIGLYVNGEEVEPAAEIQVVITYIDSEGSSDYTVTHYKEEETETLNSTSTNEEGTQNVSFNTDGFSDFSLAVTSTENEISTASLDDVYNTWVTIDDSTTPISSANRLPLSENFIIEDGSRLSYEVCNDTITVLLLSLSDSEVSQLESTLTLTDLGTLRFQNVGSVAGQDIDVLITINSLTFSDSYKTGYESYYKTTTSLKDNKISFGYVNVVADQLWIGNNYMATSTIGTVYSKSFTDTYGYPCVQTIDLDISIVKAGTNTVIDASFLQVSSDIDIKVDDSYHGTYAETFSTLSGFTGTFYKYADNETDISSTGLGLMSASASTIGQNYTENDSYVLGGIYADTESSDWSVGYITSFCSNAIEIYHTDFDVTVKKVSSNYSHLLEGAGFKLYKKSGSSSLWYHEENDAVTWVSDEEDAAVVATDSTGAGVFQYLNAGTYYLKETAAPEGYDALDSEIEFSLTSYGVIECSDSRVTLDSGGGLTITAADTAIPIEFEKEVYDETSNEWTTDNSAGISDEVQFRVSITSAHDKENLIVHDVLGDGLEEPNITSVYLVDDEGNETPLTEGTDYTVTYYSGSNATETSADGCDFHIAFTDSFLETVAVTDEIFVEYTAEVSTDAADSNQNQVCIYDGNDYTDWDTTTTTVYEVNLYKYYGDIALSDADFILSRIVDGTTEYAQVSNGRLTGWTAADSEASTLTSDSDGMIYIYGIGPGTYYLEETYSPYGYALLEEAIVLTVSSEGNVSYRFESDASTTEAETVTVGSASVEHTIKVENTPSRGTITIEKYKEDGTTPLSGVTFECADSNGAVVDTLTTGSDGIVVFEDLPVGTYTIYESGTVSGYSLQAEPIEATIPLAMTAEEVSAAGNIDTSSAYESNGVYYFYNLTFKVSNTAALDLPTTGSAKNMAWMWASLLFVADGFLFLLWRRRKAAL